MEAEIAISFSNGRGMSWWRLGGGGVRAQSELESKENERVLREVGEYINRGPSRMKYSSLKSNA